MAGGDELGSPLVADDGMSSTIGWGRAVVSAIAILVVGVVLLVYLPNWAVEHLTGLNRHGRVAVATAGFVVLLVALAAVLRRLQAHRVI